MGNLTEQELNSLSEDDLLRLRIRDLPLDISQSDVYPWISKVLEEFKSLGFSMGPKVYFGDEWFSPEGVVAISVPFFLAHPRLRTLEKKYILECEGESEAEFSRLFRHELGHAFDHAFRISKRKKWAEIFGSPKKEYHPETYRPRPYSKNFVRHLARWYAQAHPDEDFAETFAVWLDPESNWKVRYKNWGAYKKLLYMDELAKEFSGRALTVPKGRLMSDARYLDSTLKRYYLRKQKAFEEEYPTFYDRDLLRIFAERSKELKGAQKAWKFMIKNRRAIIRSIAHWTGEKKVTIEGLIARLTERCRKLDLVVVRSEAETSLELSGYLATLVSNYLFTGHFKRTV